MVKIHCDDKKQNCRKGGFRFPLFLIVIGLLFLAVNTGIIPSLYKPLLSSWPIWVLFGGILFLIQTSWFTGLALVSIGIFYGIPQIAAINPALNIPENFTQLYWPALLIVAGIYFILNRLINPSKNFWKHHHNDCRFPNSKFDTEDGFVYIKSGFDSRKHIVMDPVFKGGSIEASFGEVVVDLRKTNLAEGKTILRVDIAFGSAQIIVPMDWNLQVRGESAFGSFSDARISPSFDPTSNATLIIEGKCSFGECKIRD